MRSEVEYGKRMRASVAPVLDPYTARSFVPREGAGVHWDPESMAKPRPVRFGLDDMNNLSRDVSRVLFLPQGQDPLHVMSGYQLGLPDFATSYVYAPGPMGGAGGFAAMSIPCARGYHS